ncbi:hypothetical protein PG985_014149 [Apiospora marii]|uniref:uncharacterized protein n=1 Tax=Apiospora marii TaxID=335849 RepID=UPI003130C869
MNDARRGKYSTCGEDYKDGGDWNVGIPRFRYLDPVLYAPDPTHWKGEWCKIAPVIVFHHPEVRVIDDLQYYFLAEGTGRQAAGFMVA